jgi:predicted nuclease with TOPRIM domain
MPRQKTEAAAYLDIYKLVNEKTRLQKELVSLEERRDRIQSRLEVLDVEITALEQSAHQLRDATPVEPGAIVRPKVPAADDANTLVLEY